MHELAMFLTIRTEPGQRDALVRLWDKHLKNRAAANDDQVLYVCALDDADPDAIRITEVYATKAALEANAKAPWFASYMDEAGPLLAAPPEVIMATPHWVK